MGLVAVRSSLAHAVAADEWRKQFKGPMPTQQWLFSCGENKKAIAENQANTQLQDGAIISVQAGQCALLVSEGKIFDLCAQAGEYIYQNDAPESLLMGELSQEVKALLQTAGRSFANLGPPEQPIYLYYCNIQPIEENLYGTPEAVQYDVAGSSVSLRFHGEYTYSIENPVLFFYNHVGAEATAHTVAMLEAALKPDWKAALPKAFAVMAKNNIAVDTLAKNADLLLQEMQNLLCEKWQQRGIKLVACSMSVPKLSPEDAALIQAANKHATQAQSTPVQTLWACSCGWENSSKFCNKCGKHRGDEPTLYRCEKCGHETQSSDSTLEFCGECGTKF